MDTETVFPGGGGPSVGLTQQPVQRHRFTDSSLLPKRPQLERLF